MITGQVNCKCWNCSGLIQFNAADANKDVVCPHCGMDTRLYVPTPEKGHAEAERAPLSKRVKIWTAIALTLVALIIAVMVGALWVPAILRALGVVAAGGILVLYCLTFGFVTLCMGALAVLWIMLPYFVYRSLNRIEGLLRSIDQKQ